MATVEIEESRHDTNGGTAAQTSAAEPADASFFRQTRLLPDDLCAYVQKAKDRATDDQHDLTLAYAMSLISGWAYADHETIEKQLRYRDVRADITYIETENPAMLVVARAYFLRWRCGRLGVLAFRGTEPANLISWLTDTNAVMQKFPYGGASRIHGGFYANTEVIWDDISEVLRAAIDNRKPRDLALAVRPTDAPEKYPQPLESLYITGHSLGAAMAVVAAATLLTDPGRSRDWDRVLRGVYTFGQPMVGDRAFAQLCEQRFRGRLFRHVFDDDLVARMPPLTVGHFKHFGQRLYSPSTTEPWQETDHNDQAANVLVTLVSAATSFVVRRVNYGASIQRMLPTLAYSIDDHVPTNYIQVSRTSINP